MDNSAEFVEVLSPQRLVQRVAEQAMGLIRGAEGVLVGFCDGRGVTFMNGTGFLVDNFVTNVDMKASLAGLAIRTKTVVYSEDTAADPRVDSEKCNRLRVASSVCVPLYRGDEILGVMAVSSTRTSAFDADDISLLARIADFVSIAVGLATDLARVGREMVRSDRPASNDDAEGSTASSDDQDSANRFLMNVLHPDTASEVASRNRIQEVLDLPDRLTMTFQPIVDTETGMAVGVEALGRFYDGSPPSSWFSEAHRVGLGIELELLAVTKALAALPRLPAAWYLTVNVGPETIVSRQFADTMGRVEGRRVVMELTEHSRVSDYPRLMRTLQMLRSTGARLAIDDTGAGFSSLSHILKLAPDFIKLDRDLVAGIDIDPVRRVLAASLVDFASGTGSEIIAEGVENGDELETLEQLGVHLSQGYHHGRPAGLESLFGSLFVDHQRHGAAALGRGESLLTN